MTTPNENGVHTDAEDIWYPPHKGRYSNDHFEIRVGQNALGYFFSTGYWCGSGGASSPCSAPVYAPGCYMPDGKPRLSNVYYRTRLDALLCACDELKERITKHGLWGHPVYPGGKNQKEATTLLNHLATYRNSLTQTTLF